VRGPVGRNAAVQRQWFVASGQIDDPAEFLRLHCRHESMGKFTPGMKIKRHRLIPLFAHAEPIEGPRTAGIVDENVEPAKCDEYFILDTRGRVVLRNICDDHQRPLASDYRNLVRRAPQAVFPPGHDCEAAPLYGKHLRDRAAEADAGTGDKRDLVGEQEIHSIPPFVVS
jgi:hypothetical protein